MVEEAGRVAVAVRAALAWACALGAWGCGGTGHVLPPGPAAPAEPAPIRAGRASPPGTYGELDVVHYDAVLGLPAPGGTVVEGVARLRLRPARESLSEATLDFTGLAVLGVSVEGAPVRARHEEGRLHIPLPPGTGPADTLSVQVEYRGSPDDGLILGLDARGRWAAFVDNWPNRARFWLPSVDHPSDKATASLTVLAPEGWRVVSNGTPLVQGDPAPPAEDGSARRRWSWRTGVPVSAYNLVFGAARLEVVPLGVAACGRAPAAPRADGCVELSAWLYPEDVAQASRSFRRAAAMMDFYTELVGPYPFEKLAHVQASTRFGGMENASAIFYSDEALARGADMEGTVAHETAHQWFGDSVTEADWPELWLSEGFATYFGHLFFERAEGEADFRARLEEDRAQVLASAAVQRPVIDREEEDLFALLNANNYSKAGWVLHMLRGIVGDAAFFAGVRSYYARFAGGTATTGDFRRAMEEASGAKLGWFFRQWLEEPGYPLLSVTHRWDAAVGEVVLTLRQEQDAAWPTFRLPLALELISGEGEPQRERLELAEREGTFRFKADRPLRGVVLDPDGWVLHGTRRGASMGSAWTR
ncbi:MAG TPA: M1 family aminopeptidase [Longimicrobiales bacterium]|nr:M1 family aminopeptidase [Longimicrobiales bacterium]